MSAVNHVGRYVIGDGIVNVCNGKRWQATDRDARRCAACRPANVREETEKFDGAQVPMHRMRRVSGG